jgi:hypothetical protein
MASIAAGILPLRLHLTMPPHLITTYAMLDRGQAPPPPPPLSPSLPPPPLADIPEEDDNLYFEDDDEEEENPKLAKQQEAAEKAKVEDNDNLAFLDNLPDPEDKAAKQRALLASFESAKEANGTARTRSQAEEEQLCCVLELSVQ